MSLDIWDKLKTVPPVALKPIENGRLKGKTEIRPQWRYEKMTDTFGPCGFGWRYEIVKKEYVPTGTEIFVSVLINFYVCKEGVWSAPIPSFGGDIVLAQESRGAHTNDEAEKMALTDALGGAMKMLGLGADVYMGLANDSKYGREQPGTPPEQKNTTPHTTTPPTTKTPPETTPASPIMASEAQRRKIDALRSDCGWSPKDTTAEIVLTYKVKSSKEMTLPQAKDLIDRLEKIKADKAKIAAADADFGAPGTDVTPKD